MMKSAKQWVAAQRKFVKRWLEARRARRCRNPFARLDLEVLEDRRLLDAYSWTGGGNGNWSDPKDWNNDTTGKAAVTPPGAADTATIKLANAKVTLDAAATDSVTHLTMTSTGGTLTLAKSLTVTDSMGMDAGTITTNAGTTLTIKEVTVGRDSNWDGGTITGAGSTILDTTATMALTGPVTIQQTTFTNNGTVNWVTGAIHTNNATINDAGTFNAKDDSVLDYTGAAGGAMGSFNVIGANGVFAKIGESNPAKYTDINIPFNVSSTTAEGAVQISQGDVRLFGGGTSSAQYNLSASTTVTFAAPVGVGVPATTYTWNTGTSVSGSGTAIISGNAVVTIPMTVTVAATNVQLVPTSFNFPLAMYAYATLNGAGTLQISKTLTWTTGTMGNGGKDGAGNTTLLSGATATISNDLGESNPILDGRVFQVNAGATAQVQGTTEFDINNGAQLNNAGTFTFLGDGKVLQTAGAAAAFNNTGTLKKTGGTGTSQVVNYTQSGKGNVAAVTGGGKLQFVGPKTTMLDGTFDVGGGQVLVAGDFDQEGGTLSISGGTLSVGGNYLENGGTVTLAGGTLNATNVQIASAAVFAGSGTIYGNVTNAGLIEVGGPNTIGTLSVNGNFTQSGTGALQMEIAGTHSLDQLFISGVATLGGSLYVYLLNGFIPSVNDEYDLMAYGSRSNTFTNLYLPNFQGGSFLPRYDIPPNTFSLLVV